VTDPDVLKYQPYWRYRHNDTVHHARPEHKAWDGLVLEATNPWWSHCTPPNGWGCHCWWEALTKRELKALGKDGPDQAPPLDMAPKTLTTSSGPVTIQVPKGVDPGWGYSVGEAAFGKLLPEAEMEAWRQMKAAAWENLTPGDWQSHGLAERLPVDTSAAKLGPKAGDVGQLTRQIADAIGGDQVAVPIPDGSSVLVDAAALAGHIDIKRAPWVPMLPELLSQPVEIWAMFMRHKGTGKVVLRKRLVKVVQAGKADALMLVADAGGGFFGGWTFVPLKGLGGIQNQRVGRLLWSRR
jgi:hypothetical protein